MKKVILISIFLQIVLGSLSGQNSTQRLPSWTLEEVKKMVKKYNLQDSVTVTHNNGLLYAKKSEIDEWCQQWVKAIKQKNERDSFFTATQKVRTAEDYFRLLEAHPSMRQMSVDSRGGELNYFKFKSETLKSKWRIYRSKKGELALRLAKSKVLEEEKSLGNRIDNLPKK